MDIKNVYSIRDIESGIIRDISDSVPFIMTQSERMIFTPPLTRQLTGDYDILAPYGPYKKNFETVVDKANRVTHIREITPETKIKSRIIDL